MKRAPVSPDEATQRDQVRRLLNVLTALGVVSGALLAGQALAGAGDYWALAMMVWGFAGVLQFVARPLLAKGRVESAVTVMALAAIILILASAIIRPSGAVTVAALLVPVTAAVPYLEAKSLRRLMILAWIGTIAAAVASLLRGTSGPSADGGLGEFWSSALVSALVLFLLYQSSQNLKASNREFRRLFSLSSDLAETTEAGVLGDLVARHLAEARAWRTA
ncbi:MAG: hypothetical protein AABM40_15375 [Chloroflexota bacterium]